MRECIRACKTLKPRVPLSAAELEADISQKLPLCLQAAASATEFEALADIGKQAWQAAPSALVRYA